MDTEEESKRDNFPTERNTNIAKFIFSTALEKKFHLSTSQSSRKDDPEGKERRAITQIRSHRKHL